MGCNVSNTGLTHSSHTQQRLCLGQEARLRRARSSWRGRGGRQRMHLKGKGRSGSKGENTVG
eukprot:scaffold11352_cov114-Isochrysis_galbana.AAC.5